MKRSPLSKVNSLRRKISKFATKDIGKNKLPSIPLAEHQVKRILLCRPNHRLGNQLLISPLIQELSEVFPSCKIDLFVKGGISKELFKNFDCLVNIICLPKDHFKYPLNYLAQWRILLRSSYDLHINVEPFSSSGRIASSLSRSTYKIIDPVERLPSSAGIHMGKKPVENFRLGFPSIPNKGIYPPLSIGLQPEEKSEGLQILRKLVPSARRVVALFTYGTGEKCLPTTWWTEFYEELKKREKHTTFIEILPKERISMLGHRLPSFYSVDLREIASVISNTAAFIGADSGMMHLANASGTLTVGLFSVTDPKRYGPYGNGSFSVQVRRRTPSEAAEDICTRIFSNDAIPA